MSEDSPSGTTPPPSSADGSFPDSAHRADPIELFGAWFAQAGRAGHPMPEAVALATASPDGEPALRMVLLKGVDADGFVFFTNYGSRKARDLDSNPRAALCFHWMNVERQVRVSGSVARVSDEESDEYFASRVRGSQIGAWASRQGQPLESRDELDRRVREAEARFAGGEVPRPPFWGGYRLTPTRIEFWQGRSDRLHDRLVFIREAHGWRTERLFP